MFITLKYSGINCHGEQSAAGLFLILMQPNCGSKKHPNVSPFCSECGLIRAEHFLPDSHCFYFHPHPITHPLRGIVRYVRMKQCEQFMMGSAEVGKTRLSLSGSYGSDGLPVTVPDEAYDMGLILPQELHDAWNAGGGWNGKGEEAPAMRQWAKQNLIGRK